MAGQSLKQIYPISLDSSYTVSALFSVQVRLDKYRRYGISYEYIDLLYPVILSNLRTVKKLTSEERLKYAQVFFNALGKKTCAYF